MNLGAIILSGGKSSRFGTDKGLFLFKNKPLIQYSIDICKMYTDDIIIISQNEEYKQFNYPIFSDIYAERGPMGGIHSGLSHTKNEVNLIISSDTPFIDKKLIDLLLSNYHKEDVVIPQSSDGRYQTLIGIYHKRICSHFEQELLNNHLKMIHLIKQLNHQVIPVLDKDIMKNCFINFNHLSELQKYEH